ncbi:MAG: hypothetical protein RIQ54_578 [Candidatus Parcubacteria bacterium]
MHYLKNSMGMYKNNKEIEAIIAGGKILAGVITRLSQETKAGVTTKYLDDLAFQLITASGCKPAFLHYKPFGAAKPYPATLCASVNAGIVHGLPGQYCIQEGDLIKLDLGLIYDGMYVDSAVTVAVGSIAEDARKLVIATRDALYSGIAQAMPGNTLGDIGAAISKTARTAGFFVIEGLGGHGIGKHLHEDPFVANTGVKGHGHVLRPGMTLALEPMLAIGTSQMKQLADDSFVTADNSLSAHFEHTIIVTDKDPIVATKI